MVDRRWDWLWLLVCGTASSIWCISAAGQLSATFDEPTYINRGLERWRTGSYAGLMRLGTMPLPVDVETLPLYVWERWRGQALNPMLDMPRLLPVARTAALLFWWLLLLYGMKAGRCLAGPWGGRLAVLLLACEPTLLAHAGLATTDIAITACLLAFVYYFSTGRDAAWPRRVGLPALWFAAAVLAKASGLAFGPLCMVVVEVQRYWSGKGIGNREKGIGNREKGKGNRETGTGNREESQQTVSDAPFRWSSLFPVPSSLFPILRSCRRDFVQIIAGGLLLVFLYVGSDWRPEPSFLDWANGLPDSVAARVLRGLAANLHIFSNAGEGLVQQVKHNIRSHGGSYLLGEEAPRAFWYYFPVALSIKLSLTLLLLPLLVALARPRALTNWACLCAAVLLVFSLNCRVQIGVRLVLPLVGLAIVGLAAAATQAGQELRSGWPRAVFAGLIGGGVAWTALAALDTWPHGLCYVNELWGGPERGYVLLSDSNYDWGQGLPDLVRWQRQHAAAPLDVWYFGSDPTVLRLPMRAIPLHSLPIQGRDDVLAEEHGHYLAVSTTLLYGRATDFPGHQNAAAFLRSCVPVARTATFLIYDFTSVGSAPARATAPATAPPCRPDGARAHPPSASGSISAPAPAARAAAPAPGGATVSP